MHCDSSYAVLIATEIEQRLVLAAHRLGIFRNQPRPQPLCKVAVGVVAAFRGWMSGRHLKLRPVLGGDALPESEFGGATTRLMMSVPPLLRRSGLRWP